MIKPKPLAAFAVLVVCLYFFSPHLARYVQKPFEKTLFSVRTALKKTLFFVEYSKSIPVLFENKKLLSKKIQILESTIN